MVIKDSQHITLLTAIFWNFSLPGPRFHHFTTPGPGAFPSSRHLLNWVGYSISKHCHNEAGNAEQRSTRPSFLSTVPTSKSDTWFGGSRWWHCGLAQKNCTEHQMTRSAQTKKKTW